MIRALNKFHHDEHGAVTVEMVVLIASAVVMSIAAMIVFAPGLGTATGYSLTLLDFDREGVENPGCRYLVNADGTNAQYLMNGQTNNTTDQTADISCEAVDELIDNGELQTFQAANE